MANDLRTYLQETGGQSELDRIQAEPGGYEKANASYLSGGYKTAASEPSISMADLGPSALDFSKSLNTMENEAFGDYLKASQAQESPLSIYQKIQESRGIPTLQKSAQSLSEQIAQTEDALKGIKGNVMDTSRNSLMTQGQQGRLIEARSEPLRENLAEYGTGLGRVQSSIDRAMADASTVTGLALEGQRLALAPLEKRVDMVGQQAARMMSGFTADRETQLTLLLDKVNRQRQLSDREWQQANDLAVMREQYKMDLGKIAAQGTQGGEVNNEFRDTGGQTLLIDKNTGEIINTYQNTLAPRVGEGSSSNSWTQFIPQSSNVTWKGQDISNLWNP